MRRRLIGAKLCRVGMWLSLVLALLFQIFTAIGLSFARDNQSTSAQGFIVGITACCVALLLGVILLYAVRKQPLIGLVLTVLGGFGMIFVGVALREAAGDPTVALVGEAGISVWEMIWRHFIAVLVPLFAGGAEFLLYLYNKEREVAEMARRPRKPEEPEQSTLGL